ncbi:iron transporter [Massariosphaeria phaeospora]|uniref:Solute carrier family 40 member n=1 Tax=Massariosphaeria phaeospora TaxID=100035 RepID=A0A7C8I275_9PLEO|nr:iron transporter [Massariosphaeria phaeospora]
MDALAAFTAGQAELDHDPDLSTRPSLEPPAKATQSVLWKLYLSHTLSTWNARTFEFGAVIFLATIFPGTLFFASCYALFRSAAAALLSSWLGGLVDRTHRLRIVRQSIIWQRIPVAMSCLLLLALLGGAKDGFATYFLFAVSVGLACLEKLAFITNTVCIERDWIIVVSDDLGLDRQELNSVMRRIDLVCKLVAPLCISLVDAYSTKVAIWVVFGQNAMSVVFEYFAIAQVFSAVPKLGHGKDGRDATSAPESISLTELHDEPDGLDLPTPSHGYAAYILKCLQPWKDYATNPAFLASFALSLLYLTVLSFAAQMTTYLLSIGLNSVHVSLMRLVAVILELSATCAAPLLMKRIGAVRAGLWFVNEQLLSIGLAVALFSLVNSPKIAGGALVIGVILSRLGLWGFDLCVQYLVQEDAPEASRGTFSAIEVALQNLFELMSFATTMVFYRPEDFKYAVYISVGAVTISAACFAGFVRQRRGHLLHTSKCLKKRQPKAGYQVLPTVEEELENLSGEANDP